MTAERQGPETAQGTKDITGAEPENMRETPGAHRSNRPDLRSRGGTQACEIRVLTVNLTSLVSTGWRGLETFVLQIDTHPNLSHYITIPSLHNSLPHCSGSFWGEVPLYAFQTEHTHVGGVGLAWLKPQEGSHCNTTVEPRPLTLKQRHYKTPA